MAFPIPRAAPVIRTILFSNLSFDILFYLNPIRWVFHSHSEMIVLFVILFSISTPNLFNNPSFFHCMHHREIVFQFDKMLYLPCRNPFRPIFLPWNNQQIFLYSIIFRLKKIRIENDHPLQLKLPQRVLCVRLLLFCLFY